MVGGYSLSRNNILHVFRTSQGVQSPEEIKFPDFSRLELNYVCPRLFREHALPENFQNLDAHIG